ncbi:eukaryotic porin-domain-containing protein [Lipomyces oligophaga]|uniref:eukaryotic porin-domain-containing protein n=1 Tax=Lipomyces oligophaga TaxID=45792 RepID=UPI0034CEB8D2
MATIEDQRLESIQKSLASLAIPQSVRETSSSLTNTVKAAPGVSHVLGLYSAMAKRRATFGLTTPLKLDDYAREVERDLLTSYFFSSGLRADINHTLSVKPMFNVMHTFLVNNGRGSPYTYSINWGSDETFLRGSLDSDLNVSAHIAARLPEGMIGRIQAHSSKQDTQGVYELDIPGADSLLTLRAANPSLIDSKVTGMYGFSFSQSITKFLSLGLTSSWQRQSALYGASTSYTLGGRYAKDSYVGSGVLSMEGMLGLNYFMKFTPMISAGVSTNIDLTGVSSAMMEDPSAASSTTIACKMDFPDTSTLRTQADSTGKLTFTLERPLSETTKFSISAELDQAKNACRTGLSVQFESQSEGVENLSRTLQTMPREEQRKYMAEPPQ